MDIIEVKFSPNQNLPDGYRIAWFECDEHYHWVIGDFENPDQESEAFASKWQARRSAISHFKSTKND